jgi:hypothetical protein
MQEIVGVWITQEGTVSATLDLAEGVDGADSEKVPDWLVAAAPAALTGAMTGATVGMAAGPYGALIGGLAGAALSGGAAAAATASAPKPAAPPKSAPPPRRAAPRPPPPPPPPPRPPSSAAAAPPAAGASGASAAGALDPAVIQALQQFAALAPSLIQLMAAQPPAATAQPTELGEAEAMHETDPASSSGQFEAVWTIP